MDTVFCVAALDEALNRHGVPEIFNTDQGSQFTNLEFTQAFKDVGVEFPMDGKSRWMNNERRPQTALDGQRPLSAYQQRQASLKAA
jgi:transposase InsO family protein